jgi:transcriptional regulator with XRE-family HTH domain
MAALTGVQHAVIAECVRIREAHGLTQASLGVLGGYPRATINKWEKGRWIEDADRVIAVYAGVDGIEPNVVWDRAVRQAFPVALEATSQRLRRSPRGARRPRKP